MRVNTAVLNRDVREARKKPAALRHIATLTLALGLMSTVNPSTACKDIRLQVLGSGGPELDDGRSSSAYLLWQGDSARLLMDTGSGSSTVFGATDARFTDLDAILLTHLHTDHAADLPAFIKGSFFSARVADLIVAGPMGNDRMPDTDSFIMRLIGPEGAFAYLSSYLEPDTESYTLQAVTMPATDPGQLDGNGWQARSLPVQHGPIPAVAWRVDIGECRVVYAGDVSAVPDDFAVFAQGADLLILHAAIPENAGPAARQLHMTPGGLVSLANQVAPRHVLLSHFMTRSAHTVPVRFRSLQASFSVARDGLRLEPG